MNTKQLRSKLLSLAIRGRLVPQDPNDEPAIALLRRINPKAVPLNPDDAPFSLPDSWCWYKVKDIAKSISYGVSESAKPSGKYRLLRITDIQGNKVDWDSVPYTDYDEKKATSYLLQNDDILFARTGATVGKSYIVTGLTQPSIYASYLIRIQTHKGIYPQYVKSFFESSYYWKQITDNSVGTGQPNVNGTILGSLLIPLPPLAEQERIVKEVERWFACIEQLERSREALGKAARQTKRTLLSLAIAGRLVPQDPNDEPAIELLKRINPKFTPQQTDQPLPPGWTACTMSTLCELTDGERIKGKEMINLDAKYLRGQNEGKTLKEGRTIPVNSLLILVDGENSGEVFRTPIEGYQGSTFKRLVINDNMYEPFVLHVINSHRKRLRENKVGSAIPHLNKKLFRELTVLVPPLAEQERIVRKVEELLAVLDALQ